METKVDSILPARTKRREPKVWVGHQEKRERLCVDKRVLVEDNAIVTSGIRIHKILTDLVLTQSQKTWSNSARALIKLGLLMQEYRNIYISF